jgi:hypothetical protein
MSVLSLYFDSTADDPRPYSAAMWAAQHNILNSDGVFNGANPAALKVTAVDRNLVVSPGDAIIKGYFCRVTDDTDNTAQTLPAPGSTVKARVMLRLDLTPDVRSVAPVLVEGTASAYPALTRNNNMWDLCLADVDVTPTTLTVTDTRTDMALCGPSVYANTHRYSPAAMPDERVFMYTFFRSLLSAEDVAAIEADPGLMALYNGSAVAEIRSDFPYSGGKIRAFTASGTFTAEHDGYYRIRCQGGGGTATIPAYSSTPAFAASGGYSETSAYLTKGQSVAVVVGGIGGTSSFGSYCSAGGANGNTPGGKGAGAWGVEGQVSCHTLQYPQTMAAGGYLGHPRWPTGNGNVSGLLVGAGYGAGAVHTGTTNGGTAIGTAGIVIVEG